jgi:hypothetical protein
MVSDSPDEDHTVSARGDGGAPGFDEAALYTAVRRAVKDALLDVMGMLLLLGIAFVLVVSGGQALLQTSSPIGVVIGCFLLVIGVYLAAATLEIIPPVRDWV